MSDTLPDPDAPKVGRRVSLSVIDQAVSAASNVLVTLVAARELSVDGFGRFGLIFLLASFAAGSARSLIGNPTLVRQEAAAVDRARDPLAAAVLFGVGTAGLLALSALVVGGDLRRPILSLALVLPGIVVQDVGRSLYFAALEPAGALFLDVLWIVVEVGALIALVGANRLTLSWIVLAWGLGAGVGAVIVLLRRGVRLLVPSLRWIRASWGYAWRYFVAFVATLGASQITGILLGVISGVSAVGAIRAAQTIFGPINNLTSGMLVALVPDQRLATPNRQVLRQLLLASAALSGLALVMTAVAFLVPHEIGEMALGDSWSSARSVLLPSGLGAALLGSIIGALAGLRAAHALREGLAVELRLAALVCTVPLIGAAVDDARGYAWALVITLAIGSLLFWQSYSRVVDTWAPADLADGAGSAGS
jgi:O-antigen/teichoic acid export membrane protein